jgi:ergothioneine biosynthesis protein EgtB
VETVAPDFPASLDAGNLLKRYVSVRGLTETLAAPLSAEDQTVQSMPDVSPTKWHRAHTTWFFETFVLGPYDSGYREYQGEFAYLFNSYYESVGPRYPRNRRGVVSRPGCGEIACYRQYTDEAMAGWLQKGGSQLGNERTELGLHHEQQHQELLLMDIKHVLSMTPYAAAYVPRPAVPRRTTSAAGWRVHDGGTVEIGHDGKSFSFDNESPRHDVLLHPFAMADRLVTCGAWLEFIADGGYDRPELWLSDGWAAVQNESWTAPLYWDRDEGAWMVFTLNGRRPVDPAEPVCHVSYYEADAFAAWAGARLPTEFEWEAVARTAADPATGRYLDPGSPHPKVQQQPAFYGDAWVWTSSAYLPYPGFKPAAGAVGEYNGKFMVGQHVLRGGSCATPEGHIRPSYRNFFPPAARWPFTGVRLARDS